MWVGFHDDPSFRWVDDRAIRIRASAQQGSTIMRLLVQWNLAAPQRPASPSEPFDPAYMKALFKVGYKLGLQGNAWARTPPEAVTIARR